MIPVDSMKRALPALLLLAASCFYERPYVPDPVTAPDKYPPSGSSYDITTAGDWREIERYSGRQVTFQGQFDHIRGQHATVTLDSGLKLFIPHFDMYRRDQGWFDYVGRRVMAGGQLHTYTRDVPGYQGPSIDINTFEVVD